ncbi:efflux RND transporter periplasmic adaptor subunit [Prosthecochloris sp. SCSIO W1101]|uniref:efflux RND transporter periplasmic adaptor subunit n=1 Tax=Prosthecochloris sp. SCSIO W1101 TaxID=2992242 RepID=UPI00223D1318|nr:HlyD family efflux transporter periplasmic adaptor subunit [Prosthecochloris sp. SCSIO W1101]UZJ42285.1 efflux RND transporter periplasmic adaptor subunit [Prosthecochloris sp. SCSIO W1101]
MKQKHPILLKFKPYAYAAIIVVAGILIGRLLGSGKQQQTERIVPKRDNQVPVVEITNQQVQRVIKMNGKVDALKKIEIYAEVTGVFVDGAKPFREGRRFTKGEVLLRIEDSVYRNTVLAEKSSLLNELTLLMPDLLIDFPRYAGPWKKYLDNFSIVKPLRPLPPAPNDRLRNYVAARNIYTKFYAVRSMEETLAKYSILAPFDGVVTVSEANPGILVRNGQKLGEFAATTAYELELSAPVREAAFIRKGDRITLSSDDFNGSIEAMVARVNDAIDPNTQSVGVYVLLDDSRLKDGMYLSASLSVPVEDASVIARELLDNRNRVFALRDSVVLLLPVDVVSVDGRKAIVRGIPDGTEIVAEPVEGLFSGMVISGSIATVQEENPSGSK